MKRTGWPQRTVPLPRGRGPKRRTPLRATRAKTRARREELGFDRRTKALILDRDLHTCVCCGITAARARIIAHHRINRGHGGSRDPVVNSVAAGMACCTTCNDLMEASAPRLLEARNRGWKLRRGQDPTAVRVVDFAGRAWAYDQHGGRRAA